MRVALPTSVAVLVFSPVMVAAQAESSAKATDGACASHMQQILDRFGPPQKRQVSGSSTGQMQEIWLYVPVDGRIAISFSWPVDATDDLACKIDYQGEPN